MYDGMTPAGLAARLKAPGCLVLDRVTSTLDVMHRLGEEGAPTKTLVIADEQLAGRGRQGRTWHSPPGVGVWLAFLLRPEAPVRGGVLSLRVGLALVDALETMDVPANVKWPNDILVHERKLCGILCESRWVGDTISWIAVGLGMNVHGPLPPEIASRAIALDEVLPHVTRVDVLEHLVPRLQRLDSAATLTAHERERFGARDWLGHREIVAPVPGRAEGIDQDGALLVRTPLGTERIHGGGVVLA